MGLKKDPKSQASAERAKYEGVRCPLCCTPVTLTERGTVAKDWLEPYSHRHPTTDNPCPWSFKTAKVCA